MTGRNVRSLPGDVELAWCAVGGKDGHRMGRELLQWLYRRRTGEPMPQIVATDRGKPYFPGEKLHFSITHTPGHTFCALGPGNLGIDAEEVDRPIRLALAEKILSAEELERFREAADPRRALLTLWVLKEAAAKRSGEGLRGYPNHTNFSPEDPRVMLLDGCLVAVLTEGE